MKHYTFSDMNRASGEILETALIEPVTLTKRGKDKLVILTADQYRKLIGSSHTRAYSLLDAPQDIHQELKSTKPLGRFSHAFLKTIALTVKQAAAARKLTAVIRS